MNRQYLEPTTASRIKVAIAAVASIAFSIAMKLWWTPFMQFVQSMPVCEQLPWLRGIVIGFLVLFAWAAYSSARAGYLTLRYKQSPFPGAWIWSRTLVRGGLRAKIDGYAWLAVAGAMFVAPIAIGLELQVNVIFCIPDSCGCQ